jgi:hypothetical protein
MRMLDDASRYSEIYRSETFYDLALSTAATRIDAVHPVACSLDTFRNETALITNSKKSIYLAARLPNSSNMNDMDLQTLFQNLLAPNLDISGQRRKLRKCICHESVRLSEGELRKTRAIETRIGGKSSH